MDNCMDIYVDNYMDNLFILQTMHDQWFNN